MILFVDRWNSFFSLEPPLPFLITGNTVFSPKSINEVYKVKMSRWANQLLAQSCFNLTRALSKQRWHGRLDSPQVHTPERCLSIQNITLNADTHHPKITRREIKENTQHPWSEKHCIGSNCIKVSRTKRKSREMWHIIGVDILRAVSDDKIIFTNASRCYKSWPLAKNFCLDARGREWRGAALVICAQ